MPSLGLESEVVDRGVYEATVARFRAAGLRLPTFTELAEPERAPRGWRERLAGVDPDAADGANLYRVHWWNADDRRGRAELPGYFDVPRELSGVAARIVLLHGDTFPLIRAHKVLAAYACLVPRLVTGQFDPGRQRAVWPSTGNYCRGGVAISRILGCRGVAVLPEGMSRERFEWLDRWVEGREDVIRTPGSESNVKEIYDRCAELERDPDNVIFNQFSEFGNYLAHWLCTGRAAERVFEEIAAKDPDLRLAAFVSATGSAGTLATGDYLKERHGARVVAAEALECPTLLEAGFGEHNIQGIGDKHVPLIHNVMNTDAVAAVSDRSTDALFALFNVEAGRRYLAGRRRVPEEAVARLHRMGLSAICNLLAAIKTARHFDLGEHDLVLTVATDGAELYTSELDKIRQRDYPRGFDDLDAAEVAGRHLLAVSTDHYAELGWPERKRIFNLGYYTWVEQQGIAVEQFESRRDQGFWRRLRELPAAWDAAVEEFNHRAGTGGA